MQLLKYLKFPTIIFGKNDCSSQRAQQEIQEQSLKSKSYEQFRTKHDRPWARRGPRAPPPPHNETHFFQAPRCIEHEMER